MTKRSVRYVCVRGRKGMESALEFNNFEIGR